MNQNPTVTCFGHLHVTDMQMAKASYGKAGLAEGKTITTNADT